MLYQRSGLARAEAVGFGAQVKGESGDPVKFLQVLVELG
jgi:hypothetical protein